MTFVFREIGPYNVVKKSVVEEVVLEPGHGRAILLIPLLQKRTALLIRHRFVAAIHSSIIDHPLAQKIIPLVDDFRFIFA